MPHRKVTALFDELEAALARERFWLQRGEVASLLEALPCKADLIHALQKQQHKMSVAAWEQQGFGDRLRRVSTLQQDNTQEVGERMAAIRSELDDVIAMEGRVRRTEMPGAAARSSQLTQWA